MIIWPAGGSKPGWPELLEPAGGADVAAGAAVAAATDDRTGIAVAAGAQAASAATDTNAKTIDQRRLIIPSLLSGLGDDAVD
jgi:hypothetical protein